jgi:hypothetical protein
MASSIIILGVIGLIVAGVVFTIYTSLQEKQRRTEMAQELGFTPVESDPVLLEKITSVHVNYGDISRNRLYNVMRRSIPYGTMYIYDLMHTGRKSSSTVESGAIAIIAPGLDLPSFNVFPRVGTGGALANMANQFIESMLTMTGLTEIDFPDNPALDEKFFITGDDVEAVRKLFTPAFAALLLNMPMVAISGKGDIFNVGRTAQATTRLDSDGLRALISHATAAFDCISRQ